MNAFSSLTNRIFFATAFLAVLSISVAVYVVNRAVTRRADQEIQQDMNRAAKLAEQYRGFTFDAFGRDARFIAEIPMLQAAVDTHNPATVEPLAKEYQSQFQNADLFAIADNTGRVLVKLGTSDVPDEALAAATIVGHGTPRIATCSGLSGAGDAAQVRADARRYRHADTRREPGPEAGETVQPGDEHRNRLRHQRAIKAATCRKTVAVALTLLAIRAGRCASN